MPYHPVQRSTLWTAVGSLSILFLLFVVAERPWAPVPTHSLLLLSLLANLWTVGYLVLNITEDRRQAERLSEALDRMLVPWVLISPSGRIVRVSEPFLPGGEGHSLLGEHWDRVGAKHGLGPAMDLIRPMLQAGLLMTGPLSLDQEQPDGRRVGLQACGYAIPLARGAWHFLTFQERPGGTPADRDEVEHQAAVTHLATGISHHFNNLFAGILLNSELLQAVQGPEKDRLAAHLAESARRGGELCHSLLTFVRGEPPMITALPVERLMTDLVSLTAPEAHRQGVQLQSQGEPGLLVQADPKQALHILRRLVLGAVEATGGGGEVTLRVSRDGTDVIFAISNSGPPIPADQLPYLFLPFFTPRGSNRYGAGMELAICRTLAAGMCGALDVSPPGSEQTTFTLRLPSAV